MLNFVRIFIAPHDAMLAQHTLWSRVCLRQSQVGVLLRRLNTGTQFSEAKDLREIRPAFGTSLGVTLVKFHGDLWLQLNCVPTLSLLSKTPTCDKTDKQIYSQTLNKKQLTKIDVINIC